MLRLIYIVIFVAATCSLVSCSRGSNDTFQGYAEGEFVYVASPFSGQLLKLAVHRGDQVKAKDPLFSLDDASEKAARDEAGRRYLQAKANFEDISKGQRPTEIASLEAQLKDAVAQLEYALKNYERADKMAKATAGSQQTLDAAQVMKDENTQKVNQLQAEIQTAQLGGREDQKSAAEHEVHARKAELEQTEWKLAQKEQNAPQTGLVFDTLFREGELIPENQPVVALLPPENIKVRAFIPEPVISTININQTATVSIDGAPATIEGQVSYISTQAEYTPPVIFSRESRSKLVFMIELSFAPEIAKQLHPGQPVDVHFQ